MHGVRIKNNKNQTEQVLAHFVWIISFVIGWKASSSLKQWTWTQIIGLVMPVETHITKFSIYLSFRCTKYCIFDINHSLAIKLVILIFDTCIFRRELWSIYSGKPEEEDFWNNNLFNSIYSTKVYKLNKALLQLIFREKWCLNLQIISHWTYKSVVWGKLC